jgi:hypothetical protein
MTTSSPIDSRWAFQDSSVPDDGNIFVPIGAPETPEGVCAMFIGDSHGMAISPLIDTTFKSVGICGVAALRGYSPPLPGVCVPAARDGAAQRPELDKWHAAIEQGVRYIRPRTVIVCARWTQYLGSVPDMGARAVVAPCDQPVAIPGDPAVLAAGAAMERLIAVCDSVGAGVWVLLEVPYQGTPASVHVLRAEWRGQQEALYGITAADHAFHTRHVKAWIGLPWSQRVRLLDLADGCFDGSGVSMVGQKGSLFYSDDDHINLAGAEALLRDPIERMCEQILRSCRSASQ